MNQIFSLRIKYLYDTLRESACDINSIKRKYEAKNFNVLKRQIYRDLHYIENVYLPPSQTLVKNYLNNKKCQWTIVEKSPKNSLESEYLYSLIILQGYIPELLEEKTKHFFKIEFEKYLHEKYDNSLAVSSRIKYDFEPIIQNTHFFHKKNGAFEFNKFKHLHWCIANKKKIKITKTKLDITCNSTLNSTIYLLPIRFIFHRGCIYIGGIGAKNKLLIFELMEIEQYEVINSRTRGLDVLSKIFDKELIKRFGVSENIDNNEYEIILEFPEITGAFVSSLIFHPTQKIYKKGDVYRLKMNCGINRELVGWIMMWMNNVRIVSPAKLIDIYNNCISRMTHLRDLNKKFQYENIFLK